MVIMSPRRLENLISISQPNGDKIFLDKFHVFKLKVEWYVNNSTVVIYITLPRIKWR